MAAYLFPGNPKRGSLPWRRIRVTWGAFTIPRPRPTPGGLCLISLGWGLAATVLKSPRVTLMGSSAPDGLRSMVFRGEGLGWMISWALLALGAGYILQPFLTESEDVSAGTTDAASDSHMLCV